MKALGGILAGLALLAPCAAAAQPCGEVLAAATHAGTTTRYVLAGANAGATTLVLLPGGGGHLDLDATGCPRALAGNSLVRSAPLFRALGFATVLVDAPSDHHGEDGLGGFRSAPEHAQDLGKVIAAMRARNRGAVWLVGTSRGAISAANAAARLEGAEAPDGLVLTSALMSGTSRGKKAWTSHTVFGLPLDAIRVPLLLVGHAADRCVRSPARLMHEVAELTNGAREQVVTVSGGRPPASSQPSLQDCEGRSPHGFLGQEAEVAEGIARFVRGGRY